MHRQRYDMLRLLRHLPVTGVLLLIAVGLRGQEAQAFTSIRTQEISECRGGEIATWGDGVDRPAYASPLLFTYNPLDAPAWFPAAQVTDLIVKAASAWSQCGVRTQMIPWRGRLELRQGMVVVQWSEKDSAGNFGLANFSRGTLSLGAKAFEMLRVRNPSHDASQTLQMVISHEMGHLFGLMAHSRRCVDVLSYYHNGKGEKCFTRGDMNDRTVAEYRHSFPTACDIERCRRSNGLPPTPGKR